VHRGEDRTLTIVLTKIHARAAPAESKRSWYKSSWLGIGIGAVVPQSYLVQTGSNVLQDRAPKIWLNRY